MAGGSGDGWGAALVRASVGGWPEGRGRPSLVSEVREFPFQACQFVALAVGFRFQGVEMAFQRLQGAIQGVQLEPLDESRPLSLRPDGLGHRSA